MPIEADWDNEDKTVIRYEFRGKYSAEEFEQILDKTDAMSDSVNHMVHYLVIIYTGMWIPKGVSAPIGRIYMADKPNRGVTVVVGASVPYKTVSEISQDLYQYMQPNARIFVRTVEEARTILNMLSSQN
jgi:hypothetical protein